MMRTFFTGSLIVLVAGAGYWYWTQEPEAQSGKLTHTPKMDTSSKGKSSKRSRWAKALAKSSPKKAGKGEAAAKAEAKAPVKLAKQEPAKKDSSNKAFAGLKASSLSADKKDTKLAAANKGASKAAAKLAAKKSAPKAEPKPAKKQSEPAKKSSVIAAKSPSSKGMESVKEGAVQGFSIPRIALATGVENREPVSLSKSFANGSRVHLFMEARNLSDSEQTLMVHWHDPALADPVSVPLSVPAKASRYRTWANSSPLKRSGAHEVSVQIKDGPEIYRRSFEVLAVDVPATKKVDGRSSR